ncbi:hypothetical protein FB451DRAFT_1404301 [Mycena latifolia]|nr:hypothetical protein FB451DRAFT_1404301 [Mycena latifolia]
MDSEAFIGAIDPALLREAQGDGPVPLTTNGASITPISSIAPFSPAPSRVSKSDITTWLSSNFAPRTHVTRKDPLYEACGKLAIKVPKSASLSRLREALVHHWFTDLRQSVSCDAPAPVRSRGQPSAHSRSRSADQHDVLASVLAPTSEPIHFAAPAGATRPPSANHFLLSIMASNAACQRYSITHIELIEHCSARRVKIAGLRIQVPFRHHRTRIHVEDTRRTAPSFLDWHHILTAHRLSRTTSSPPIASAARVPVAPHRLSPATTAPLLLPSTVQRPALASTNRASSSWLRAPSQHAPQATPRSSAALEPSSVPLLSTSNSSDVEAERASAIHIVPFQEGEADGNDEAELIRSFDVQGANAYELLGYDDEEEEEEEAEADEDAADASGDEEDSSGSDSDDPPDRTAAQKKAFRTRVRVEAVQRFEGNRRTGGLKTQAAMVKAWNEFTAIALAARDIDDAIVDEHSLLLYIKFCAERPKRTRRGMPIEGMFLGAEQDAADTSLVLKRPAVSVFVYDAIKNRMDEALERVRNGMVPSEDAPDIRANTWLSEVTDEQLERIGQGFLAHRHLRLSVFGHLAWTAQHASGNRGDDFRALKLAEMQSHTLLHPDKRTAMPSILGLQGEEKAGQRGMRTVINPVYSVFIPNLKPEMCPFGAFAFYFHYLHDEKNIMESMNIDWTLNKSWRAIRVLHGQKSPTTPFNENNMYNMYCRSYNHAGFTSKLKTHLPRHLLGYKQEALGVDAAETSRLGWVRGETYMDTYAAALPKTAILAAAGYRVDEQYDPIWRHVRVPERFLLLVCPIAEEILESVAGKPNLSGTTNDWQMIIDLRSYLFQCGAAIYQKWPQSSIFRLPAFHDSDVLNWMKTTFPSELAVLRANAGNPVDLERIQNTHLRVALEEVRNLLSTQTLELKKMVTLLQRRTAVFSPAQGFSTSSYHRQAIAASAHDAFQTTDVPLGFAASPAAAMTFPSPRTPQSTTTMVEPPVASYYAQGAPLGVFPPLLEQKSASWTQKSVEQFADVKELWTAFVDGAAELDSSGNDTGRLKPPLKLVEQYFQAQWCSHNDRKERNNIAKVWQRFREIPEWIDTYSSARDVSPDVIITELEAMRELARRRKATKSAKPPVINTQASPSASSSSPSLGPAIVLQEPSTGERRKRERAVAVDARRRPPKKKAKILDPAAVEQSLLNLATVKGFQIDKRRLRILVIAQLNKQGKIDGFITEDSDVFVFGAQCVIRTSGPYVQNMSSIYTLQSIETMNSVSLDRDGLFLCALLLGGDYDSGIDGVGPRIARALAVSGFGHQLVNILRSFEDPQRTQHLNVWCDALREELRTNSSGNLVKRQPKLAMNIPDTFPKLDIAHLYLAPLTSASPEFFGEKPDTKRWMPEEPSIRELASFCSIQFGWHGEQLLKKLHNNLRRPGHPSSASVMSVPPITSWVVESESDSADGEYPDSAPVSDSVSSESESDSSASEASSDHYNARRIAFGTFDSIKECVQAPVEGGEDQIRIMVVPKKTLIEAANFVMLKGFRYLIDGSPGPSTIHIYFGTIQARVERAYLKQSRRREIPLSGIDNAVCELLATSGLWDVI